MKDLKKNWKVTLIALAGVLAVILLCVFGVQSSQNKAFALEEQVNSAESDIKIQEKRRVDLVYNLADCVLQYAGSEEQKCSEITFLGHIFPSNKVEFPSAEHIDTIKESSHVRHKYYGVDTEYIGTIFTDLRSDTITNNTPFYVNMTIEQTVKHLETGSYVIFFWIFWIILTGLFVYGFYYLDNNWLEN